MDKKKENEVILNVVIVVLVVVFVIAVMMFDYLKGRNAAERYETRMTEMTKEIGADSRARMDRWTQIIEAQRTRRQQLELQNQEWMTEMSKEIGASSQSRVERWTEIVEAQRRRRQPLRLQITHVHSSTCGHPPHDNTKIYSAPYYPRVGRQRRR